MTIPLTTLTRLALRWAGFSLVGVCLSVASAEAPRGIRIYAAEPGLTVAQAVGWTADQTPADFLDSMGLSLKARWRQLYREPPPAPPTARPIAAFTLGGLVADSFLAMQATDAQQFRNNNQDIQSYCRVLGLGDKLGPRLMSQGKLAETDHWTDLRQEVVDGHQELCRVLREQRDEDLAVLVDMGVWMRMMDMVAGVVAESPLPALWPLCIGSPSLLKDLQQRFAQLTEATRNLERVAPIGELVDFLCRHWLNAPAPDLEKVIKTRDKLKGLIKKLR